MSTKRETRLNHVHLVYRPPCAPVLVLALAAGVIVAALLAPDRWRRTRPAPEHRRGAARLAGPGPGAGVGHAAFGAFPPLAATAASRAWQVRCPGGGPRRQRRTGTPTWTPRSPSTDAACASQGRRGAAAPRSHRRPRIRLVRGIRRAGALARGAGVHDHGLVFLVPLLMIILVIWYKMRRTRMMNETMLKLAERGVVPPVDAIEADGDGPSGPRPAGRARPTAPYYEQAQRCASAPRGPTCARA